MLFDGCSFDCGCCLMSIARWLFVFLFDGCLFDCLLVCLMVVCLMVVCCFCLMVVSLFVCLFV